MSIGTFAWAGRTAAAAAARHVMNLLPAVIQQNNRKNKGSTDTLNGSVLPKKWAAARLFRATAHFDLLFCGKADRHLRQLRLHAAAGDVRRGEHPL